MSEYEAISLERSGPIARITLNRADAANSMNDTMTRELAHAARRCDDSATKVVILTGAGRFFSAGGDLRGMASSPTTRGHYVKTIADDLHRAISTFARMDAVLITAVNGVAAGAGFSLAVTGDLVLVSDTASFTMAYTAAGLSPDGSSSFYLPRLIGVRKTQELMLTNRKLDAAEALQWGLVTEVVDCRATRPRGCTGKAGRQRRKGIQLGRQEIVVDVVQERARGANGAGRPPHRRVRQFRRRQ